MVPPDRTDLSRALVAKAGETFLVTDADASLPVRETHPLGFFREDARHLSVHELRVDGERPELVGSGEDEGGVPWAELRAGGRAVRLVRAVLADGRVDERITVGGSSPADVELTLDADFEPMLILRGVAPPLPPVDVFVRRRADGLELGARGRDGVWRSTTVRASPPPASSDGRILRFRAVPGEELRVVYELSEEGPGPGTAASAHQATAAPRVTIRSDDPELDAVVTRAFHDLDVLGTPLGGDLYAAAGVPWYVALFGRDSLITGLQALPFMPAAGTGSLRMLAARIGTRLDPWRDEEPGKILHELRSGELARLEDHTPLSRYYGTVDATALFLCALVEQAGWSGSLALSEELADAVEGALGWIGDRLLTYSASSTGGLRHQAWKDSDEGLPDEDGSQPQDPVAVVEAQGYVVAARRGLARLAEHAGDARRAGELLHAADTMATRIERFWLVDKRCYSMALGGPDRRPLRSVGSNQGHLLWARAVTPAHAGAVRDALLSDAMWSGWGVRTLASTELAYDPVAYHRGSVWPHDTALFAAGLRWYGFDDAFARVCGGLLDAAAALPHQRLPELFSGNPRVEGEPPETYPAACRPQAWAAGTVPLLLRCALGLEPDGLARRLVVRRPMLPGRARELELSGLHVAGVPVDLRFTAGPDGRVEVDVSTEGELEVDVLGGG